MNRDFKGVWIPKEIWELPLKLSERIYLGIYKATGDINETDMIMKYSMSLSSISHIKQKLIYLEYITEIKDPEKAKQFVLSVIDKGDTCEWCGRKNYVLHEHHYPVSKKNGGTNVVRICPNCHMNYHKVFKGD